MFYFLALRKSARQPVFFLTLLETTVFAQKISSRSLGLFWLFGSDDLRTGFFLDGGRHAGQNYTRYALAGIQNVILIKTAG